MSDSDDDLLALADVGSETEQLSSPVGARVSESSGEPVNPYPLEGRYRDAEDRARLDAMPEVEREALLYERDQETQRFNERRYLAQRRKQLARPASSSRQGDDSDEDDGTPLAKRQRGTTGVSSGTKSGLEALKSRRLQQSKRSSKRRMRGGDDESGDSDAYSDGDGASGSEYSDDEGSSSRRSSSRRSNGRGRYDSDSEDSDAEAERRRRRLRGGRSEAEWADEDEAERLEAQSITLSDVNRVRWGRTLFARYCLTPGFVDAVPGCFVRVNVGTSRDGTPVYRLCQVRRVVSHRRYRVLDQTVDEAILATVAGSERTLEFGSCSDSPATPAEFEFWTNAMRDAGLTLPTRRRAQQVFGGVRALSKRVLTSEEIDEMVRRRAALNGQRGANAVLAKAELLHEREIAIDAGDAKLVREIDAKLNVSSSGSASSASAASHAPTPASSTASAGASYDSTSSTPAMGSALEKLYRVNQRNKRANGQSVRKAEVQANTERRKAGNTVKADPFSRLRTTARVFYQADAKVEADQSAAQAAAEIKESAAAAKQLQNADLSLPLGLIDDLIARIDIEIDIDI